MTPPAHEHRFGFVAVCGRPNVGKSTLVNAMVGEPVAVATEHPQTTRERMLGICTKDAFQAVLVDTPGLHRPKSALNRVMVAQALAGCRDVDVVLFLAETPQLDPEAAARWAPGDVAKEGLDALARLGRPLVLVLTKTDRLVDPRALLPITAAWRSLHEFDAVVPVAALQDEGIDALLAELVARLPEGPAHYPADQLTDRPMRWHAAEQIRAELFVHLAQELPYSCAVVVDTYQEKRDTDAITATIHVERDSQRGMVIGKGARVVKAISIGARGRIERLTGRPCDLRIRVDVARDWTRDPTRLAAFGYVAPDPLSPADADTGAIEGPEDPT